MNGKVLRGRAGMMDQMEKAFPQTLVDQNQPPPPAQCMKGATRSEFPSDCLLCQSIVFVDWEKVFVFNHCLG